MRPPARLLALFACLLAVAGFAGCGSDESSPLDSSLGYLPEDAPFAVAIDTDVEGEQFDNLNALFEKFPFGDQIRDGVLKSLGEEFTGVSLEKDVVPLLGNPFVVGAADSSAFTEDTGGDRFIAAIEVSDEDKLNDLLEKTGAERTGEQSGATIYDDDGTEFAVDGANVVFAGDREQLDAALERHDGGESFSEEQFSEGLEGIGDEGILQAYVDVGSLLLGSEGARNARKVEWIGAIETVGLDASLLENGIEVDFRVGTDAEGLTDEDLPIAAGDDAPPVVDRPGEIGVGVRDVGQIVTFAETVAQAVDPSGYGDYAAAKRQLEQELDVDVEADLLEQLSGDISASVSLGGDFGVRVEPEDPAAFERTLAKVADTLPDLVEGAGLGDVTLVKPKDGDDFYALAGPEVDGVVFGVKNEVFVVTNDPARADSLALDEPIPAEGAEGSVVMQADAEELVNALLGRLGDQVPIPPALREAFTKPLGELSGSLRADTSSLTGKLRLTFD